MVTPPSSGGRGSWIREIKGGGGPLRHAERDALEDGARLVAEPSEEADAVSADEPCIGAMCFNAGNHGEACGRTRQGSLHVSEHAELAPNGRQYAESFPQGNEPTEDRP
jgi:hypothetical protein